MLTTIAMLALLAVQPPVAPIAAPPAEPASFLRFGEPAPRPKSAGSIRIISFNIENLFDDQDDPTLSGEQEDKTMTKPADHRRTAAAAIRALDADVVALLEVESLAAVRWFRDEFLADAGYDHVVSVDAGDDRGIENAVLSRYPLSNPQVWPDLPLGGEHPKRTSGKANPLAGQPIAFRRSPLKVRLSVPNPNGDSPPYEVDLYVVHHKSGQFDYWREREANKIAELIRESQTASPDRNILLLGDFNDKPGTGPSRIYSGAGLIDSQAARVTDDPRFITHASGRTIDFILMSPAAAKELVPGSPFVLGMPTRPEGADWRTTPPPPGYASDHYPIVIDLIPRDQ